MFNVSDYVVYGSTGVCQIVNIRKDDHSSADDTEYYILDPIYANKMTIMVPVNNTNSAMRPISTKDDVLALIAKLPGIETAWNDDERQRSADFKAVIKSGKNEELVKIIKTLYLEKEARAAVGRKLTKTDEEIFNVAEKKLNQEFAVALNISVDEVLPYILDHVQ